MAVNKIITQVIDEFGKSAYDINCGECEDFAMRVIELMGGYSPVLTDMSLNIESEFGGHVWIEYNNRYYDAECLGGVADYRNLPIFQRSKGVSL